VIQQERCTINIESPAPLLNSPTQPPSDAGVISGIDVTRVGVVQPFSSTTIVLLGHEHHGIPEPVWGAPR
jgi:hypothetical protein